MEDALHKKEQNTTSIINPKRKNEYKSWREFWKDAFFLRIIGPRASHPELFYFFISNFSVETQYKIIRYSIFLLLLFFGIIGGYVNRELRLRTIKDEKRNGMDDQKKEDHNAMIMDLSL